MRALAIRRALWGLALVAIAASARAADVYAHVEFLAGEVTIVNAAGDSRHARVGDDILEGETIRTGPDGELHARTGDHGFIAMRPRSELKVDSFAAKGDDADHSVVTLLRGTFRSITGWIGKYQRRAYMVKTPTATIGVRGTDHEPLFQPTDEPNLPAGTYDKVNAGGTYIETPHGRAEVEPGHAGFASAKGTEPPRLLEHVPETYKPSRNEHLIESRREELAHEMEQARTEAQRRAHEPSAAGSRSEKTDSAERAKPADETSDKSKQEPEHRRRRRPAHIAP